MKGRCHEQCTAPCLSLPEVPVEPWPWGTRGCPGVAEGLLCSAAGAAVPWPCTPWLGGQAPREATAPSPTTVPSSLPLPFGCNFWFALREPNATPAQSLSTRQQLCYNFSPKAALALLQSSLINLCACEHVSTPSVQPGVEQCHLEVGARGL